MTQKECCCKSKPVLPPNPDQSAWISGMVESNIGPVPQLAEKLHWADVCGAAKVRCQIGRMTYGVAPGLYAVGNPACGSPVLVTANYKLSVDTLRRAVRGHDFWVLVLDTDCVNVWCAAGKGTFGTEELIHRLKEARVDEVTCMKLLILPQLGAPGVDAREVTKRTGFAAVFGPVRAEDIPAFAENGMKATPAMRRVDFGLRDRMVLVPVDLIQSFVFAVALAILAGAIPLLLRVTQLGDGSVWKPLLWVFANWLWIGISVPAALPLLPGRPFSVKGIWPALALAGIVSAAGLLRWDTAPDVVGSLGATFFSVAFGSFVALNLTGTTTFTSQSGAMLETKVAVPCQIALAAVGAILWIIGMVIVRGGS